MLSALSMTISTIVLAMTDPFLGGVGPASSQLIREGLLKND